MTHTHALPDQPLDDYLSAHDQAMIQHLADQKLAERLVNDAEQFADLASGIDSSDYLPQVQRCLRELDGARRGNLISLQAVTEALTQIERTFTAEARKVWLEELSEEAETELFGVPA
jgi:hypothetical protein